MTYSEDKARFSLLMRHNNSTWKRAVSWLYHSEPEESVVEIFSLDELQLSTAKVAVDILHRQNADYDRVNAWANPQSPNQHNYYKVNAKEVI